MTSLFETLLLSPDDLQYGDIVYDGRLTYTVARRRWVSYDRGGRLAAGRFLRVYWNDGTFGEWPADDALKATLNVERP